MTPIQAVQTVLRKYTDFSGRASRSEYWWWWATLLATMIVIGVLTAIVAPLGYIAAALVVLGSFIPNLAVTVRRLHDTGRSGWWLLIAFVPVLGALILLVFLLLDSEPGPNQWGTPSVHPARAESIT